MEDGNSVYDSRNGCNAIIETSSNTLIVGCQNTIIPNSVTSIGPLAFEGCSGLTSVTIPNSMTSIGSSAFYGCSGLTSVTISQGITRIGSSAFYDCNNLTSVTMPSSLTSIGSGAFYNCSSLVSITIPDGVTSLDDSAFSGCHNLKSIAIPNSVTYIGRWAFENTAWYENQKEGVVYAGKVAYGYKGTVPNSLVLQEGTSGIAAYAFFGCRGLSSVEIPSGVVEIGRAAFYGTNLESITLPNSVTRIGGNAFDDTPWYRESTPWYGGLLYASNILYRYKGATPAETTITLRDGTSGISIYAFMDYAKSMVAINIPNSVSWIGDYAFNGCISLASINISQNVTSIGEMVFGGCDNLRNIVVDTNNPIYDSREDCNAIIETQSNTIIAGCSSTTIPHSITSIGNNAFEYHRNLVSIAIPYSITEIGDYAFRGCSALTSIVSEIKNPFRFGTGAFSSISTDCTLTVPYGTKDSYIAAGWTEDVFKGGIVEAPYNPTSENTLAVTDAQVLRGRQVVLPVSMSNTEDITAIQFDLTLPAWVSIAKNTKGKYIVEKTERCADHTLSASKPGEANVYKVLLYSTEVENITGNEGAVINVTLEATENMEAGDYEVRISNINLTTTAEKKIAPADVTCVLTVRNSIPGDANGDGSIDVTDIVAIANSILGHASESFDAVAADVNGDGSVDVTDIVVVANIILHDGGTNAVKLREAMQMLDPQ